MTSIEFAGGAVLDLEAIAADPDLPPWLADRADDAAQLLAALRDAVDAARALEEHRRRLTRTAPAADAVAPREPSPAPAPDPVFACPHRDATFATAGELLEHLGEHIGEHRGDAASHVCEGCGRVFTRSQGLGRHRPFCPGQAPEPAVLANSPAENAATPALVSDDVAVAGALAAPAPAPARAAERLHPAMAVCGCGHTQRRHEDGDGICQVGACECTGYETDT